jgi:hypothetical protein
MHRIGATVSDTAAGVGDRRPGQATLTRVFPAQDRSVLLRSVGLLGRVGGSILLLEQVGLVLRDFGVRSRGLLVLPLPLPLRSNLALGHGKRGGGILDRCGRCGLRGPCWRGRWRRSNGSSLLR